VEQQGCNAPECRFPMRHDYGEETNFTSAPRKYGVFIGGNTHTCIYSSTSNSCAPSTPLSLFVAAGI
jgi:hypothetical protein